MIREFGWARIEYDEAKGEVFVNTDGGSNEYYIPTGFGQVMEKAGKQFNPPAHVFIKTRMYMILKQAKQLRNISFKARSGKRLLMTLQAGQSLPKHGTTVEFDGLVADFEGLRGEGVRKAYNLFLSNLKPSWLIR